MKTSFGTSFLFVFLVGFAVGRPNADVLYREDTHGHNLGANVTAKNIETSAKNVTEKTVTEVKVRDQEAKPELPASADEKSTKEANASSKAVPNEAVIEHPINAPLVKNYEKSDKKPSVKKAHHHDVDFDDDDSDEDDSDESDEAHDIHDHDHDDHNDHGDDSRDLDEDVDDGDRDKKSLDEVEDLTPSGSAQVPSFAKPARATISLGKNATKEAAKKEIVDENSTVGSTLSQESATAVPPLSASFVAAKIKKSPLTKISSKIKLTGAGSSKSVDRNSIKEDDESPKPESSQKPAQIIAPNAAAAKSIAEILEKVAAERRQRSRNNSLDTVDAAGSDGVEIIVLPPSIPTVKSSRNCTTFANFTRSASKNGSLLEDEAVVIAEGSEAVTVVIPAPSSGVDNSPAATAGNKSEEFQVDVKSAWRNLDKSHHENQMKHHLNMTKGNEIEIEFPFGHHQMAHLRLMAPSNATGSYEVHGGHGRSRMASFNVDGDGKFAMNSKHSNESAVNNRKFEDGTKFIGVEVGNVTLELTFKSCWNC